MQPLLRERHVQWNSRCARDGTRGITKDSVGSFDASTAIVSALSQAVSVA
jgi:hypothetical protein